MPTREEHLQRPDQCWCETGKHWIDLYDYCGDCDQCAEHCNCKHDEVSMPIKTFKDLRAYKAFAKRTVVQDIEVVLFAENEEEAKLKFDEGKFLVLQAFDVETEACSLKGDIEILSLEEEGL